MTTAGDWIDVLVDEQLARRPKEPTQTCLACRCVVEGGGLPRVCPECGGEMVDT